MKEKRKGFTLIELLAVIVILAIIALIATPIVLNIIKTSRKGAFVRSAEGVLQASKIYYASSLMEEVTPKEQEFTCDNKECLSNDGTKLDVDGNMGEGIVTITGDGKISFELGNGTYCAEKKQDSNNIKVSKKVCGELVINKPSDLKVAYKTENAGEITVTGSVSNDDSEIKSYEFSIDNGTTWVKAESNTYTFKGLEMGKEYKVLMRVTNLKDEQEQIELEPITTSLLDDPTIEIEPSGEVWAISKTVTIKDVKIDENIYKVVYSFDGINYQDYIEPIEFKENGAIKIDIVRKEDNTSILKNKAITKNVLMIDATVPTVSLEGVPDEIREKEEYVLPTTYTVNNDLSGGSVTCTDESGNGITNTSTLSIGEHTITCIVTTGAGNTAKISKTIAITEQTYKTGDPYELGGYKWHVMSDDGKNLTLLMDANQLGSNSTMNHCTSDTSSSTDCGVSGSYYLYSWDKSKIRTYLNGTFLTDLESKINNDIVTTPICADPAKNTTGGLEQSYGGYLMSELSALGKTEECSKQVSDKVRLITESEYWNMSPYYSGTNNSYPNTHSITRMTTSSDYATWLYCNGTTCGDSNGYWWTMGASSGSYAYRVQEARYVTSGSFNNSSGQNAHGLRPVITIVK